MTSALIRFRPTGTQFSSQDKHPLFRLLTTIEEQIHVEDPAANAGADQVERFTVAGMRAVEKRPGPTEFCRANRARM